MLQIQMQSYWDVTEVLKTSNGMVYSREVKYWIIALMKGIDVFGKPCLLFLLFQFISRIIGCRESSFPSFCPFLESG